MIGVIEENGAHMLRASFFFHMQKKSEKTIAPNYKHSIQSIHAPNDAALISDITIINEHPKYLTQPN